MIPVNFTTATLLHVSRGWMLACLSSLPGGCGPVSHSCTMHGKLKIYNIFMVCFHLRLVLDCSEWSRMFYVPSLLAYFGMFMWLSFCPFFFYLSFFFFFLQFDFSKTHCATSFVLCSPFLVSHFLSGPLPVAGNNSSLVFCFVFLFKTRKPLWSWLAEDDAHIRRSAGYPRSVLIWEWKSVQACLLSLNESSAADIRNFPPFSSLIKPLVLSPPLSNFPTLSAPLFPRFLPPVSRSSSYSTAALEFEKAHQIGAVYESPRMSRRSLRLQTSAGHYGNESLADYSQNRNSYTSTRRESRWD